MKNGKIIRKARLLSGLTLEGLALAAETDASNLSRIERDKQKVSLDLLCRIADALRVPVPSLLPPHASGEAGEPHFNPGGSGDDDIGDSSEAYRNEIILLRRSFTSLNAPNRLLAVEFVKLLSRMQRYQAESDPQRRDLSATVAHLDTESAFSAADSAEEETLKARYETHAVPVI